MKIMLANFAKMVGASGGLAKVTCAFANEMVARGHDVSLVYCDERQGAFFYPVDDKVRVINLCHYAGQSVRFPWWMKLKRELLRPLDIRKSRDVNDQFMVKYLQDSLKQAMAEIEPEIIVASQPAATRMLKNELQVSAPVITMSHGDPEDYFHTYPVDEVTALGKSEVCQVLMPSFAKAITNRFPEMYVEVIGNVVPQYASSVDLDSDKPEHKILFIGRLTKKHKRPHLLLEAFSKVADEFPDWQVEIWGAVDKKIYYEQLRRYVNGAGLDRRVVFKGTTNNVEEVLRDGDIFVFPSAFEGFGLSLAEAMSMGLPVIGYQSCPAVNELIVNGRNGLLCEDGVEPLAEALRELMSNRSLRIELGDNARNDMKQYNGIEIWNKWEELLARVLDRKGMVTEIV